MSLALLKKAEKKIERDQNREKQTKAKSAELLNKLGTVGGGAIAALYDHKKGSEDGAEPAKLFQPKDGPGGVNANLAVGAAGVIVSALFKFPGRGIVGSTAAGMAACGLYRTMMENFEKR